MYYILLVFIKENILYHISHVATTQQPFFLLLSIWLSLSLSLALSCYSFLFLLQSKCIFSWRCTDAMLLYALTFSVTSTSKKINCAS